MPFFDVKLWNTSTNTIIKGETVTELKREAKKKLGLSNDPEEYRLVLEEGHAEVDEDVLELASLNLSKLFKIIILLKNEPLRTEPQENRVEDANNSSDSHGPENIRSPPQQTCGSNINMSIIEKICQHTLKKCQNGEELSTNEYLTVKKNIVAHLFGTKDTSRGAARTIVTALCSRFPKSLAIRGKAKTYDQGLMSLLTSVENGIQYDKTTLKLPKKPRKRRVPSESKTAELQRQKDYFDRVDEFGCVEFLPDLPDDENEDTQQEAREELLTLFDDPKTHSSGRVSELMRKTYPTHRALITAPDRNISTILTKWPFLKIPAQFFQHASILLGKNVVEIWNDLLLKYGEPLLHFLTIKFTQKETEGKFQSIMKEKDAAIAREQKVTPQYSAIFPILLLTFKEDASCLYKLYKPDSQVKDVFKEINTTYPILIIQGSDIYDGNGKYTVVVNAENRIICDDFLDGVLITFLSYYIFGYAYNPGIENTLSYIQRDLLAIVEKDGTKLSKKSRRGRNIPAAVVKLSDQIIAYANNFSMAKMKGKQTSSIKEKINPNTPAE
ncbi:hypothetical protein QAD02_006801 [Eretmocerus hayati]|uniref:Uncharacterized protein n=1 Tax=Eretmocerus hayati TaxID=131215 RepID=A0ACC2N1W6_9HYME|nr:hypothetical protein QAD02_006801 [Eretmocerus hayati]